MIFCGRWLKNEALEWPRKGESAWGKGFICLQKMAFRAHQAAQERRRGVAGHLLRRELHRGSGGNLGNSEVEANPTRASCTYSSGGNISTAGSGKPHARELHQVSDFGHVIVHRGKPHAHASCTARCRKSDTCHRHRANPTRTRAAPYSRGGNVSTSGFKQTPRARELHFRENFPGC